jgi:glycosyltransferase involved in cell wall biosynthesis
VIVVDDRSTDDTAAIVGAFDDPRLVVVDGEEKPAGWLGKPWAMHQGSVRARGELLLFMDADILYRPETVRAAVSHMQRNDVDMLSVLPRFEMHGFWENVAMPMLPLVAITVMPLWISNRTRIAALGIGGGPGNLVTREAYDRAGGHTTLKDEVIDDVELARIVRRAGGTTECVRADHLVSVRMYHGAAEIIDGFTKNLFSVTGRSYVVAAFFMLLTVVTEILPYFLALTGDPFAYGAVALLTLTRLIVFASLRYRLDSALFAAPLMAAFWLVISARSVWKTGIRRQLEWRGRMYDPR